MTPVVERSNGRDRPNDREYSKKKKFSNSSNTWMSANGEDLSDGDNSSESNMVWGHEEYVGGQRVGAAMQAGPRPDLVCMDSGCNRIILVDLNDMTNYRLEPENSFLPQPKLEQTW